MKIAILGIGNVGGALARLWALHGHTIFLGIRDKAKAPELREAFPSCQSMSLQESVKEAETIAICLPWHATEDVLKGIGEQKGKIMIDCTNPLAPDIKGLAFGGTISAAEKIQAIQPRANVIKAFNSLGAVLLGNADFRHQLADGFYCGDDAQAKKAVAQLVEDAGLHPVDVGSLRNSRYLEALAMLWIDMALHQKRGGDLAFKMLLR